LDCGPHQRARFLQLRQAFFKLPTQERMLNNWFAERDALLREQKRVRQGALGQRHAADDVANA
jgi:hypothetical protein